MFNSAIFSILLYKTNRLHFPVVSSVIDTEYDVICGKNKKWPLALWTLFLFLPHMSSYCVSIIEQTTGKYNLFVNYTPRPLEFFNFILNFR